MTCAIAPLEAKYVIRDGSLVSEKYAPTMSYVDHYSAGCTAYNDCHWKEAHRHFYIVSDAYSNCPLASDALFYLGVCYFNLDELDIANATLDSYLASDNNPRYFELAFDYKYNVAEKFRCGSRRRYLGSKRLPKWACGRDLAVKIYDEVISSLPSHDLAVRSLYSKGWLLWEDRDFKGAVDAFQSLIRRFPKNELTPECYILINHVYLEQALYEFQNPDLLALAEINAQRFIRAFPKEERVKEMEDLVVCIKEVYAKGLYDIGMFYERTCKRRAAIIYYQNAIARFPTTGVAQTAVDRLMFICPFDYETVIPKNFYEPDAAPFDTQEETQDKSEGSDIPEETFNKDTEE